MLRFLPLTTLGFIFFCGCQPEQVPTERADTTFHHKVECEKYRKGLEEEAKQFGDTYNQDIIYSVFYSTKRNSCLVDCTSWFNRAVE